MTEDDFCVCQHLYGHKYLVGGEPEDYDSSMFFNEDDIKRLENITQFVDGQEWRAFDWGETAKTYAAYIS